MVKNIILSFKGKNSGDIASGLLNNKYYRDNVKEFYQFFSLQGGTIHQLAGYIVEYNSGKSLSQLNLDRLGYKPESDYSNKISFLAW